MDAQQDSYLPIVGDHVSSVIHGDDLGVVRSVSGQFVKVEFFDTSQYPDYAPHDLGERAMDRTHCLVLRANAVFFRPHQFDIAEGTKNIRAQWSARERESRDQWRGAAKTEIVRTEGSRSSWRQEIARRQIAATDECVLRLTPIYRPKKKPKRPPFPSWTEYQ